MTAPTPTVADREPARRASATRRLLVSTGVLVVAIVIALLGTGTSYALWNGRADIAGGSVSSGTTGVTASAVTGLDLSRLGPGQSVVTSVPVTVTNGGSTKLAVAVASTTVGGSTALAAELSLTVTQGTTCSVGMTGGTTGRLTGFTTTATPVVLDPGTALDVCLQVTMDLDAPISVKNLTSSFTLNLTGSQVR